MYASPCVRLDTGILKRSANVLIHPRWQTAEGNEKIKVHFNNHNCFNVLLLALKARESSTRKLLKRRNERNEDARVCFECLKYIKLCSNCVTFENFQALIVSRLRRSDQQKTMIKFETTTRIFWEIQSCRWW